MTEVVKRRSGDPFIAFPLLTEPPRYARERSRGPKSAFRVEGGDEATAEATAEVMLDGHTFYTVSRGDAFYFPVPARAGKRVQDSARALTQ
jgi:hypothetical protein